MRKRLLGLALITGAFVATLVPAGAGPYRYSFGTAQAAVFSARLHGGGTATAYLVKLGLEPAGSVTNAVGAVSGGGVIQAVPAPVDQEAPGVASAYEGCIVIRTKLGRDYGCRLLQPSTVDFDALMSKGQVTFAVRSEVAEGRRIVANLLMTGTGTAPTPPTADCRDHQNKACSRNVVSHQIACPVDPCTEGPYTIGTGQSVPVWFYGLSLDAQNVLARDMAAIGSVRSEHVGGGGIVSTDVSRVFYGMNGSFSYDVDCLVRLGTCRT